MPQFTHAIRSEYSFSSPSTIDMSTAPPVSFNAVLIEAERGSGRATSITQLQRLIEV